MHHWIANLLVALLPAVAATLPAPVPLAKPLVFANVTVIDATGAPAKSQMTVIVKEGRIAEIGKTGKVAEPANAVVLDCSGKYMIPGLWDMHVHWYDESSLPLFTANGVTGIRVMCGYPRHLRWRREVAAGKLIAPRMSLAGPIVDGPEPAWPDSLRAGNEAEGRLAVRTIKKQGYDCVKVYNLLPRSAYFGVADEARKLGLPLVGHVPFAVTAAEAADAGQRSIEHLSAISLACSSREAALRPALAPAIQDPGAANTAILLRYEVTAEDSYDAAKAAALGAHFLKNGTWLVPTLTARQAHALLTDKAAANDARSKCLPPSMKERWDNRRAATFMKLGPADFANYKHSLRKQLELVAALHQAGVRFLAGTDTGALDCYPGFGLHQELELLVKAGLTPMEALQAATRNAAQYLEQLTDLGTVEPGKLADLVLLDANPLEDICNTTKIHAVVQNGRLLLSTDLRAMLKEVEVSCRERKQPDMPPGANSKYP